MNLYIDTETYSTVPLDRGLARYSTQVEITIIAFATDDGPIRVWDRTRDAMPLSLMTAAQRCDRVVAHNAPFDRTVIEHCIPELAALLAGKWYCTMAACLRHGLPGGLDKLSTVFRLPEDTAKHDGHALVMLFCKPNKHGRRATRHTHPDEWRRFLKYAGNDITAMREVYRKVPKWNDTPKELALWDLDQTINQRGIAVDAEFAAAAVRATTAERKRLTGRTQEITGEVLDRTTQRDRLLAYLFMEFGVDLPDLKADTVERRLNDPELPEFAKELLRIRQVASKASTAKYRRLLEAELGGRLYNLLQYCGAPRTGRWAGRIFQPHNLPRRKLPQAEIERFIDAAKSGCEDIIYG